MTQHICEFPYVISMFHGEELVLCSTQAVWGRLLCISLGLRPRRFPSISECEESCTGVGFGGPAVSPAEDAMCKMSSEIIDVTRARVESLGVLAPDHRLYSCHYLRDVPFPGTGGLRLDPRRAKMQ